MHFFNSVPKYDDIKSTYGYLLKPFIILCSIYILALSALIRANFNYIDDLGRITWGYRSGENFSRYVSHFLAIFVHSGLEITDISPLPQILAAILVAAASCVLLYRFADKKISIWSIVAVLPVGLSPYFMECFSYKFDSLWMAFSLFASVMPLIFIESHWAVYFCSVVVGTLATCMSYQAFSGLFVLTAVMYLAKKWNEGESFKSELSRFIVVCVAFVSSMLFYKFFLLTEVNSYVSSSAASFPRMLNNVLRYFGQIKTDSTCSWLAMTAVLGIGFVYSVVCRSVHLKWLVLLLAVPFFIGCAAASYGAYIALQKPLFAPRALGGFGVFLAIAAVIAVNNGKFGSLVIKLTAFAYAWGLVVFALTYGNALAEQERYTDFRVQMALEDFTRSVQIEATDPALEVQLSGDIGKSPIIRRIEKKYPILRRLVPSTLGGGWIWNEIYFFRYFALPKVQQIRYTPENNFKGPDFRKLDMPTVYQSFNHVIKSDCQHVLIQFF